MIGGVRLRLNCSNFAEASCPRMKSRACRRTWKNAPCVWKSSTTFRTTHGERHHPGWCQRKSAVPRVNATCRPSGDTAGVRSPRQDALGKVSFRFSPVSIANQWSANPPVWSRSEMIRDLLSGSQLKGVSESERSATFRSTPPTAGMTKMAHFSLCGPRTNTIQRPSGDHAGARSASGAQVRRTGGSTSIFRSSSGKPVRAPRPT